MARFVKEFSVGYQKFIYEESGVTPEEEDVVLERMDNIGFREVENMARLASQSEFSNSSKYKGKSQDSGGSQPKQNQEPKRTSPKQYNKPIDKKPNEYEVKMSQKQIQALEKMGVSIDKIENYDQLQNAFKNPDNFK